MATTSKSKTTKTTKTATKAKAPAKGQKPAPAKAPKSVTHEVVVMLVGTYPNIPSETQIMETLQRDGLHASPSTIKTVREHTRRALKVLSDIGYFPPRGK